MSVCVCVCVCTEESHIFCLTDEVLYNLASHRSFKGSYSGILVNGITSLLEKNDPHNFI